MKKYFIVLIALVFLAATVPAFGETVFNEMAGCVKSIGKGCAPCAATSSGAQTGTVAKMAKKTDVLGNKVSCMTDNSGKTQLGK
ncbi:MAG: hypothetical protein PHX20_03905 [Candidatus Omnitrophica bacterium]|nr:hypothetical protein [Candidatus Omnitrophota bacterium]MDD5436669.1 hypothetical protein [Candidatus Omnitrophota bacterium]